MTKAVVIGALRRDRQSPRGGTRRPAHLRHGVCPVALRLPPPRGDRGRPDRPDGGGLDPGCGGASVRRSPPVDLILVASGPVAWAGDHPGEGVEDPRSGSDGDAVCGECHRPGPGRQAFRAAAPAHGAVHLRGALGPGRIDRRQSSGGLVQLPRREGGPNQILRTLAIEVARTDRRLSWSGCTRAR